MKKIKKFLCCLGSFLSICGAVLFSQSANAGKFHIISSDDRNTPGYKVVLLGDTAVGKTSLLNYFKNAEINKHDNPTVGGVYHKINVDVDGQSVLLNVWDTAGQEKYRSLAPMYLQDAKVAIIVCAQNDHYSFDNIDQWRELALTRSQNCKVVVAANKSDLDYQDLGKNGLSFNESVIEICNNKNMKLVFTSAITGQGVDDLFYMVASHCINNNNFDNNGNSDDSIILTYEPTNTKSPCC